MDSPQDSLIQALRLAAIVEGSDDAIVSKDTNGVIVSWNAAAERMFGWTAAEAIGRSIRMIIPFDRQFEEDMVLARIRSGERVDHFETVRCRKSGERFDVSITVSPIRTPDGRIIGASKIARDISERKRNERALAEARAEQADLRRRLTTIIDAAGALLLSPRIDDVLAAMVTVAREVLPADAVAVWHLIGDEWRIASSQNLGTEFAAASVPADRDTRALSGELLVIESVDEDRRLQHRRLAYDAEGIRSTLVVPLQIGPDMGAAIAFYYRTPHQFSGVERESAAALGRLASAVIATARLYESQRRRRIESDFIAEAGALLVSSIEYRDTLATLASRAIPRLGDWCAFHLLNDEGVLETIALAANRSIDAAALDALVRSAGEGDAGFTVESIVRSGTAVLVQRWSPDSWRGADPARIAAAERLGLVSLLSVPLVAHRRTFGALTLASFQHGASFGPSELGFAQDLAYRVALSIDNVLAYEEARTANRLKDEFLANLSHELRTPLNAIVGYAQMLRKGALPPDRLPRAYEVLEKNASALTQIVEDVLDVSRIIAGKIRLQLQPVALAPIVVHSVETVQPGADAKGVRIEVDDSTDGRSVAGDADRLQQVFWNILSNAVKFTPRGGLISVRVSAADGASEVTVTDDGAGIDPKFLPHIFERFRQGDSRYGREYGGLGLGLAIARQIVEMHGGTIAAESAGVGRGATFRVVLPAVQG